jgi:hypothetical protein
MSCPQNLRLPSRVAVEKRCLPSRGADERKSDRKHQERRPSRNPEWGADEREARHAAVSVDREGDEQERAQRVGDYVDGREPERIHDLPQERSTVVEQVDAAVVERIGQPVTGTVDREHAVGLRESREDRHDLVRAAQPAVDVQQRRPGTELEDLCLAL